MKQILFTAFAAAAVVLSSCSKDDNDHTKSNPMKISIGGAKYIYENPNATRASSGELSRFMAVNDKGESKPIRLLNSDNDTIDMNIWGISNLNDEYILVYGSFYYKDKTGSAHFTNMLANKKTELIYAMNTDLNLYNAEKRTYTDQNNNAYWSCDQILWQFNLSDPNNIRLSEYIPEGQEHSDFIVNSRGFCSYRRFESNSYEFKFKCPGGRIYNTPELLPQYDYRSYSVFRGYKNDTFFIVTREWNTSKIICYELVENGLNELVATQRSEISLVSTYPYMYHSVVSNHIQKTHMLGYTDNAIFEYNEETQQLTERNTQFQYLSYSSLKATTKNNLFIYNTNELVILKLSDNTTTRINLVGKYELSSMEGNMDSDEVTFSGLRFSDGRNIVGTIDESGQFHAIETINATKETVLIRLN